MAFDQLTHNHLLLQGEVASDKCKTMTSENFKEFLMGLVETIDMEVLILPQVTRSEHDAWTGIIGIVTSHIAFHYWKSPGYLQLDIYSCKPFDSQVALSYINQTFDTKKTRLLKIQRNSFEDFRISNT